MLDRGTVAGGAGAGLDLGVNAPACLMLVFANGSPHLRVECTGFAKTTIIFNLKGSGPPSYCAGLGESLSAADRAAARKVAVRFASDKRLSKSPGPGGSASSGRPAAGSPSVPLRDAPFEPRSAAAAAGAGSLAAVPLPLKDSPVLVPLPLARTGFGRRLEDDLGDSFCIRASPTKYSTPTVPAFTCGGSPTTRPGHHRLPVFE